VCDSAATRPSSQITLDRLVLIACKCGLVIRSVASVCLVLALTFDSFDLESSFLVHG